jgi:hypothetical protein
MAKAPRKPKALRYPKTPKRGASLEVMKRYKARCADVDRKNAEKAREYNRKIEDIKKARQMHTSISGIGRTPKMPKLKTL